MSESTREDMEMLLRRILVDLRRPPAPIKEQILGRHADEIAEMFPPTQIPGYNKFWLRWCWCGEAAVDGRHCNEHSDLEVGDG